MNRPSCHPKAFTLVEVTLALGITSFAIVSILGGMLVGMNTLKGAIDTTVEAQITQHVVGSLKQANYSTLADYASPASSPPTWKYDERGLPVVSSAAPVVYSASVQVDNATLAGGAKNLNLLKVQVKIENLSNPATPHSFATFISNNGQ